MEAGAHSALRGAGSLNNCMYIAFELRKIQWDAPGQVLFGLGPHELDWIEFGRITGKRIDLQARVRRNEMLHQFAFVDRCVVPEQDHRAAHPGQQSFQERSDMCVVHVYRMTHRSQSNTSSPRCHQQGTEHIHALPMVQTRADTRRLPARGPRALAR